MRSEKELLTISVNISVLTAMEQSSVFLLCCMDLWSTKNEGIKLNFLCECQINPNLIHYDL